MSNHIEEANRPNVVCPGCAGYGMRANPAFDGMSVSPDEFDGDHEAMHEFLSEYTRRGGMYDVVCPDCQGRNVVKAECECQACEDERVELAEYEAERRAEMRMGC